jgi:glycosyltransferase involved in cell wall biosynthesis
MKGPEISVVVPVWNQRRYLRQAVQSLLDEQLEEVEIIVVDDASTDGSLATIADLPVRVVSLAENAGGAGATNAGIRAARGDYVAFLDSDDLLVPGGLRWRLEWVRRHPAVEIVAGRPAGIIGPDGEPRDDLRHVLDPRYTPPSVITLDFYRSGRFYPVNQWLYLFRRDVFDQVGLFDPGTRAAYDCELLFRVLSRYEIPLVFDPLVLRRLHGGNLTVSGGAVLTATTIAECERIFARHGVPVTGWALWEHGLAG